MEKVSSDMTLDPQLKIDVDAQDQQAIDHPLIDATDLPLLWAVSSYPPSTTEPFV